MAGNRPKIPKNVETEVLLKSKRRCALCFGLHGDRLEKPGQIAHLDQDPANNVIGNLCWLCLPHHDKYDSTTSQTKGLTASEVRSYRDTLYTELPRVLAIQDSEWEVLTKNWSYQAILNSLVDVGKAHVEAINNSQNVLQNTRIHAKKTQLLADNSSSNIVDKSSFHGLQGSVSMDAIQTKGPISIQDSSVGFGAGGTIGFGIGGMIGFGPTQPRPIVSSGKCQRCEHQFNVDVSRGVPVQVQCPNCQALLSTS